MGEGSAKFRFKKGFLSQFEQGKWQRDVHQEGKEIEMSIRYWDGRSKLHKSGAYNIHSSLEIGVTSKRLLRRISINNTSR